MNYILFKRLLLFIYHLVGCYNLFICYYYLTTIIYILVRRLHETIQLVSYYSDIPFTYVKSYLTYILVLEVPMTYTVYILQKAMIDYVLC